MRAVRVWSLDARGHLKSALEPRRSISPTLWKPGVNIACCKYHKHAAPVELCRCGFRGQEKASDVIDWLYDIKEIDVPVIGVVELSGRIFTGDSAHPEIPSVLRAQYAEVCELVISPWFAKAAPVLSRHYGATVRVAPSGKRLSWLRDIECWL